MLERMTDIGVWPTLIYRDGQQALRFLTEGLGFVQVALHPGETEGSIAHAELHWPEGGGIMIGTYDAGSDNEFNVVADGVTSVYLVCKDPDGLLERVTATGIGKILRPLRDEDYGSRGFTATDHEDNRWSVGTYRGEG
jgi:uncharacterized glyoxalase superfamily protein PhnB